MLDDTVIKTDSPQCNILKCLCRYLFFQQSGRRGEEEPHKIPHNYDDIISARRLDGYVTTLEPALVTSLPRWRTVPSISPLPCRRRHLSKRHRLQQDQQRTRRLHLRENRRLRGRGGDHGNRNPSRSVSRAISVTRRECRTCVLSLVFTCVCLWTGLPLTPLNCVWVCTRAWLWL